MAKKALHPEWYTTKVYCDGKLIMEVGGTQEELAVDIWSEIILYTGSQKIIDAEGRVEKFQRKYSLKDNEGKNNK
jgi:large subunit ribosomal protein L31